MGHTQKVSSWHRISAMEDANLPFYGRELYNLCAAAEKAISCIASKKSSAVCDMCKRALLQELSTLDVVF